MLLFACYLLTENKTFLLRARIDLEKAREQAAKSGGEKTAESMQMHMRIATLAKFDDAVRTYINCPFLFLYYRFVYLVW